MSTAPAAPGAEEADPGAAPPGLGGVGRHSLIYAVGLLVGRLVAFLMLPVYTRYLTPADFGTLQLLLLTMDIFSLVAGARLASGIYYYYAHAPSESDRKALLSTAMLLLGASYAIIAAGVALAAGPIARVVFGGETHVMLLRLAATAFFFEGVILVGLTALQVRERSRHYVGATTVRLLLQVTFNLFSLIVLGWGIEGMMLSTVVANLLTATWLASSLFRYAGVHLSRHTVAQLVRFGIPLIGTQVATMVAAYGDRYVLNAKVGPDAVGIYSLALQFGVLVFSLGFMPFNQVWEPRRFDLARRPDRDELYSRAFRVSNLVLITLGLGAVLFVDDYLRIASTPAFRPAAMLVPICVLAYVFQAWSDFQNLGIMMRERTSLIALANWVCAGAAWAGYLLLIPRLGAYGAATALAIAFLVRQQLQLAFSQRLWRIRYNWRPVLTQLGYASLASGVALAVPFGNVGMSLLAHAALFVLYLVGVWCGGVLTAGDRRDLLQSVRLGAARLRSAAG